MAPRQYSGPTHHYVLVHNLLREPGKGVARHARPLADGEDPGPDEQVLQCWNGDGLRRVVLGPRLTPEERAALDGFVELGRGIGHNGNALLYGRRE